MNTCEHGKPVREPCAKCDAFFAALADNEASLAVDIAVQLARLDTHPEIFLLAARLQAFDAKFWKQDAIVLLAAVRAVILRRGSNMHLPTWKSAVGTLEDLISDLTPEQI